MPEHFHLLVTEPRIKTLWVMMQVLKQRVSRQRRRRPERSVQTIPSEVEIAPAFWLPRYYDFNVYSREKRIENCLLQKNETASWLATTSRDKKLLRGLNAEC